MTERYHRLWHEANRTVALTRMSFTLGALGAGAQVLLWAGTRLDLVSDTDAGTPTVAVRVVVTTVAAVLTHTLNRRWIARRDWYADTERWWERLDEAPSVIPFPRLVAFFNRAEVRR